MMSEKKPDCKLSNVVFPCNEITRIDKAIETKALTGCCSVGGRASEGSDRLEV